MNEMQGGVVSRGQFIREIWPRGILSYAPDTEPITLRPLNVLIGANGSGKSNFIELLQLFKAAPSDLAAAVRTSGGINELIWKGNSATDVGQLVLKTTLPNSYTNLGYDVGLRAVRERFEITHEEVVALTSSLDHAKQYYYMRGTGKVELGGRVLDPRSLDPQQSVLSQRKDPDLYPEITALGVHASRITTYREWAIGPNSAIRYPQPADLPNDVLLPDVRNLGMILNAMSVQGGEAWGRLNEIMRRFLPRFTSLSTYVAAGTVQVLLHEDGLRSPVGSTRISDGTIRFIALMVILLRPQFSSLICLEEPELGLHPDALRIVADLLVEASKRTQIVVTTQSDVLISALSEAAESVLVCDYVRGGTRMRQLDAEKLRFWLADYQLGEVWRMGELGGNP